MTTVQELRDQLEGVDGEREVRLSIKDSSYYDGPSESSRGNIRVRAELTGTVVLAGGT